MNNGERERGGEREKVTDEEEKERERVREKGRMGVCVVYVLQFRRKARARW